MLVNIISLLLWLDGGLVIWSMRAFLITNYWPV